jgi:hypothetical protein
MTESIVSFEETFCTLNFLIIFIPHLRTFIKSVVGEIDNEIVCALKFARFKSFLSLKGVDEVESIYDSITTKIKKIDKNHPAYRGMAFLIDDENCAEYEMDLATKSSIKMIYDAVKVMSAAEFTELKNPPKRLQKRKQPDLQPLLSPEIELEKKIRKRLVKLNIPIGPQPIQVHRIRQNSFKMVCPGCDYESTVTNDLNNRKIRMVAMEKHLKEHVGQNVQVYLLISVSKVF